MTDTYLVIDFDRYDTHKSDHYYYKAENIQQVIVQHIDEDFKTDLEYGDDYGQLKVVSDQFACISGEESDLLIYKLQQ